jgi:hypothetical protein
MFHPPIQFKAAPLTGAALLKEEKNTFTKNTISFWRYYK